ERFAPGRVSVSVISCNSRHRRRLQAISATSASNITIAIAGTVRSTVIPNFHAGAMKRANVQASEAEATFIKKKRCAGASLISEKSCRRVPTGGTVHKIQLCIKAKAASKRESRRHACEKSLLSIFGLRTFASGIGGMSWTGQ